MILSKETIARIDARLVNLSAIPVPVYPEKVIQFGTGVLLRALIGYFIDKANKQGAFNGSIVIVKSTKTGDISAFKRQDNLYTLCVRGIESGQKMEENIINSSISRVLTANDEWPVILELAENPDMQIVISNTTEVGLVLSQDDIHASPPSSFPGKLLAFLYRRFIFFKGDVDKGMVIIPTELIPDNGRKLQSILLDLAIQNALEPVFMDWLIHHNEFCSSLVDRIVPGKLPAAEQVRTTALLGYEDDLMIMAETYRLWAIESDSEHVKEILSFAEADTGVVIAPDIQIFRELKLRILNGSHTLSCGLAHLAGFRIVKEAMADTSFSQYVENLMMNEIIPVITNESLPVSMAQNFAKKVLDRYRNPYIEHQWLSITMQYSSKINMRDTPLLLKYIELFQHPPVYMSLGWAAHLLFMRSTPGDDGQYYGEIDGKKYLVNDNQAAYYSDQWKDPQRVVSAILSNTALWGTDLSQLPGFVEIVQKNLDLLQSEGAGSVLKQLTH